MTPGSSPSDSNEEPESGTADLEGPRRDCWTLTWNTRLSGLETGWSQHLLSLRGGAVSHHVRAAGMNQTAPDQLDLKVTLTVEDPERGLWDLRFTSSQVGAIGGSGAEYRYLLKLVL